MNNLLSTDLLARLGDRAEALDQSGEWPEDELKALAGATRAAIGREWGGEGHSALDQHLIYETLARRSLTVSLIVSQRDAAAGLIEASKTHLRNDLLPRLASGEIFATVGIAQLTTSRQGASPALRSTRVGQGYRFDGLIPWCTGAAHADYIVAGGASADGQQVLALMSPGMPGVQVDPPMPLVALRASWTASIRCESVEIKDEMVLRVGDKVLTRGNHLPLGQTFLAMGLCRGAIDLIQRFRSPVAEKAFLRLDRQLEDVRAEVLRLSEPGKEAEANEAAAAIRGRCNDLALRAAHVAVTLYKGTGLLAGHPAQRLAREALFLLVWSCPSPVIDCTVDLLTEASNDA